MAKLTIGTVKVDIVAMAKLTNSKKLQLTNGKPSIQLGKWMGPTPDRSKERVSISVG